MELLTDALTVSPGVAAGAASERTEAEARFEQTRRLGLEWKAARRRHGAAIQAERSLKYGTEEYVRAAVESQMACTASIAAQDAYHKACDAFFLGAVEVLADKAVRS